MNKNIRTSNSAEVELKNGFLHVQFTDMSNVDLEEAKIIANNIIDLCDGTPYPFITNGLGITIRMDNAARDLFASYPPLIEVRKAQALLVNNMPSKLLANFFIKYHKPLNPTKIFTNYDEAVEWLEELD